MTGGVVTCTGDVSAGIDADGPTIDTLNVFNVFPPGITPAAGVGGIDFYTVGDDINIDVDTSGTAGITTTGNNAEGIRAFVDGDGNVDISNIGDITTDGNGADGVYVYIDGDGDIVISNDGDINTSGSNAEGIYAYVNGDGDITVTNTGDITAGDDGIYLYVNETGNITLHQTGDVVGQDDGIYAENDGLGGDINIFVDGDVTGNGAYGIYANSEYGNTTIRVNGNITSQDDGIDAQAYEDGPGIGNVDIIVNGDITSDNDHGIDADAYNDISIVLNGNIQSDSDGIDAASYIGSIRITSNGNITVDDDDGIRTVVKYAAVGDGAEIHISNTGNIDASDTAIVGGRYTGAVAPATITTSGILTGGNGFAVDLRFDGNDVVNLLGGSIINGAMDFGNGNDGSGGTNPDDIDTLNFLPGLNATVDFADTGGYGQGDTDLESAPEIINFSGGGVLINGGLTAVAVDATGFAAQGTMISDVTDAILSAIDSEGGPPGAGLQSTQAFARGDGAGGSGMRLWGSGFGGHHHLDGTSSLAPFNHDFGGFATGIETGKASANGAFGLVGGYSYSKLTVDFGAGDTETDTAFGGAYFKRDYGAYRVHAAFVAGATDNDATRYVNGVAAQGDFNGYFLAPSLSASTPVSFAGRPMRVGGRATYVYMNLDGYTESGIANPLTVAGRSVSLFNLRGQVSLPHARPHANGSTTLFNLAFGVDATIDAGSDDVNAIVAATPFVFAAETQDQAAAFVGLNVANTSADGSRTIGFSGEMQSDFSGGTEMTGQVKASFRF